MIYNLTDHVFVSTGALAGRNPIKLRQYDNRLWAVCDDGALVFSDNGDASTWNALNIILAPNREPIIDFQPIQGGALLITRTSVYAFYGSGTYQDTSILLIQDRLLLSDSAVQIDNTVYILGNRGVHVATLNGIKPIPHDQTEYFKENYPAWNALGQAVQGVFLYKFNAILYLFQEGYGSLGFLYYVQTGAFFKLGQMLPPSLPYLMELNASATDFLIGSGSGDTICRSVYPAGILSESRSSVMQFRHEDADSMREKIWRRLGIVSEVPAYNVLIQTYLDHAAAPTLIRGNSQAVPIIIREGAVDLVAGDNIIDLFGLDGELLRSKSISIEITVGGSQYLVTEDGQVIVTEIEPLVSDDMPNVPANFAIREIRLQYREVGGAR